MMSSRGPLAVLLAVASFGFSVAQAAEGVRATLAPAASRQPAPAFRLADVAGKPVQISDYRGKILVLNFWATECGGCKLEIPWFIEIARAHEDRALRVVGVSEDIVYEDLKGPAEAWARVTPFVQSHRVNYTIVMGDDSVTKDYNINALPATYLVDRRGRIAATYIGLVDRENLEANIKSLLAE
jgi:peroxiredoxin